MSIKVLKLCFVVSYVQNAKENIHKGLSSLLVCLFFYLNMKPKKISEASFAFMEEGYGTKWGIGNKKDEEEWLSGTKAD
ncbi:hypothetical protein Tco_0265867 [Tanacetum coccineum]